MKFETALFEAAAWIAVARLNYIKRATCQEISRVVDGLWGGATEIRAYWAGLEDVES